MKRYEKYKSSDIDWIGEIPSHWNLKKLKYIGESIIGITYSPDDVTNDDTGFLVLRSSNIQNGKLDFEDNIFVQKQIQEKHITKPGDILLCARNGSAHLVGKSALIGENDSGKTFGAFMTVFRSEVGRFLFYFFNSQVFKSQTGLFSTSTINQLTSDTLNNMFVALPSDKAEQTAIANFLDEKTKAIDTLISNKQKLIELLKEERTAIINEALSGDGKNWDKKKISYGFKKIGSGTTPASGSEEYYNGTINWLQTGDLHDSEINFTSKKITEKATKDYSILRMFPKGSLVVAMYGATIGKVGILNIETTTNQACCVLADPIAFDVIFVFWWFVGNRDLVISKSYGGGQPNISQELIRSLRLPCPPLEEQKQIAQNIQTQAQRIESTISKIEKEIELLNEYRTALISEVVTGKIKVE